jgi:hypothetical protein
MEIKLKRQYRTQWGKIVEYKEELTKNGLVRKVIIVRILNYKGAKNPTATIKISNLKREDDFMCGLEDNAKELRDALDKMWNRVVFFAEHFKDLSFGFSYVEKLEEGHFYKLLRGFHETEECYDLLMERYSRQVALHHQDTADIANLTRVIGLVIENSNKKNEDAEFINFCKNDNDHINDYCCEHKEDYIDYLYSIIENIEINDKMIEIINNFNKIMPEPIKASEVEKLQHFIAMIDKIADAKIKKQQNAK